MLWFYCYIVASALIKASFEKKTNSKSKGPNKIINGKPIDISKVPYFASLVRENYDPKLPICGAAIISKKHLLTAGHCMSTPGKYHILTGSSQLGKGRKYQISKYKVHPKFSDSAHDISVVTLSSDLAFGKNVQQISLPKASDTYKEGAKASIVGFGRIKSGGRPDKLQHLDIPILSLKECEKKLTVYDTVFCAGGANKQATCFGDSGGPLVLNNQVIGLVSYGRECYSANYPTAYTDIRMFLDFIKQETNIEFE